MHVLSGDLWAGAEVLAWTLLQGLNERQNVALKAILLNEGEAAQAIRTAGVEVCILDERNMTFRQLLVGLRKHLRDFAPQIVHAHRYKENLLCYGAALGMRSKPILAATQHGMPETYANTPLRYRMINRGNFLLLSRFYDVTVAVSQEMHNALVLDYGFQPKKLEVVYNGIRLPQNSERDRSGHFCVGTCGRLVPVKNYALFLKAAERIAKVHPEIRFVLAGDGPEEESLKSLVAELGLHDRVSMPGHVDDMASFYERIDLFVNTSIHEGIPMSVLEAMGHGVPVVIPKVGGLGEIVDDGKDGFLIPPNNLDLYVKRCLQLYSDEGLRIRLTKAARKKIAHKFTIDRMTEAYLHLYNNLLNKKGMPCSGA